MLNSTRQVSTTPTHLGITFYRNSRIIAFNDLSNILKRNGCAATTVGMNSANESPGLILHEVFADINASNATYTRLNIVGEIDQRLPDPELPDDFKDIQKVTQYAKSFLEARGLSVDQQY